MSGRRQLEVQLGHLCNNRCVFCISGQLTALGKAPVLHVDTIREEIRRARESGHSRLTFLGGEPTIQPFFLELVQYAVDLGFDEIVVFSNGSRTGSTDLIDRVLATGGRFEWRFSFQGATLEAHERTTRRAGSFAELLASVERARAFDQRVTVNMCVVEQNYLSLGAFPALLVPRGVSQLHVDMFHPLDTGDHTEEELRGMIPRYTNLAGPLREMVAGMPPGFDVNIGNLPQCIAPDLAPFIHHGGEGTTTITAGIEGRRELNAGWNKYEHKQRSKTKPGSCGQCVFSGRCSGVFDQYAAFYGVEELKPVSEQALAALDPEERFFSLRIRLPVLRALQGLAADIDERGDDELRVRLARDESSVELALRRPGTEGIAATDRFVMSIVEHRGPAAAELLATLWGALSTVGTVHHPLGDDALAPIGGPVGRAIARLRRTAPHGALQWDGIHVTRERAELHLRTSTGERTVVWLEDHDGRVRGGYRLEDGLLPNRASAELREGLSAVLATLGSQRTA
jgi:MoaA/NifB/PqqE/SkfB family radical SAM enzyme